MTSKPLDSKQTKPDGHGDGRGRHRTRSSTKEFASRKTNGVCSRRATRRMLQANGGSMDTTRMTSSITTSRQPWTEWRSSVLSSSTGTYNSGGGELLHRLSEERRSRYREGHRIIEESYDSLPFGEKQDNNQCRALAGGFAGKLVDDESGLMD